MIITGCQCSGMATMARILGIGHEVQFTHDTTVAHLQEIVLHLQSEASWMAMPFLEFVTNAAPAMKVIHLVRHPLAVCNSMMGLDFWTAPRHKLYRDFLLRHLPSVEGLPPLEASMVYWVEWNRPLMSYPRIRIEDWQNTPRHNSREQADYIWSELPEGSIKRSVEAFAKECGYGIG